MKVTREELEALLQAEWAPGLDPKAFRANLSLWRKRIRSVQPASVLLAEALPERFLPVFFAAVLEDRDVFLGNPSWGKDEWRQAWAILPDVVPVGRDLQRPHGIRPSLSNRTGRGAGIMIPNGGSGGRVRFAVHTLETLAESAKGFQRFFGLAEVHSRCLLPLVHVSGLMQVMRSVLSGGTIVFGDRNGVFREGEVVSLVATQLRRLLSAGGSSVESLRTCRLIPIGGGMLPQDLLDEAAVLGLPLAPSYGMTETAAMVTALPPEKFREGDRHAGFPLAHIRVNVVAENGEADTGTEAGQIHVDTDALCHGYYGLADSVRRPWATGDTGFIGADGGLRIVGREGDRIVSGGEKIYPGEVEGALMASGFLSDVVVVGVPDPEWGEVVAAAYVPLSDALSMTELTRSIRSRLSPFKVPKVWVPLPRIPRALHGKVDRMRLKAEVMARREALHEEP